MKLPLIAVITLLGIGMGIATLVGAIPRGFELPLWTVIAILAAFLIARMTQRRFLNGLMGGLLAWFGANCIVVLFFDSYLRANPSAAQSLSSLPSGMSPRLIVLVLGTVLAVCYGLAVGLLAVVVGKVAGRKTPSPG